MIRWLLPAAILACSAPAIAEPSRGEARKWEAAYLTLSAIDAAETIHCLRHDQCEEANPLFGKHPGAAKLIAGKVALGAIHFAVFERLNGRNPRAAMRFAQVSVAVQGGVVLFNARIFFK
jgi:hypothetical protein